MSTRPLWEPNYMLNKLMDDLWADWIVRPVCTVSIHGNLNCWMICQCFSIASTSLQIDYYWLCNRMTWVLWVLVCFRLSSTYVFDQWFSFCWERSRCDHCRRWHQPHDTHTHFSLYHRTDNCHVAPMQSTVCRAVANPVHSYHVSDLSMPYDRNDPHNWWYAPLCQSHFSHVPHHIWPSLRRNAPLCPRCSHMCNW